MTDDKTEVITVVPMSEKEEPVRKLTSCFVCLLIMFGLPLAIFDLYYGFKNNECVNSYSPDLEINMETYLKVSGIISISFIALLVVDLLCIINNDNISFWLYIINIIAVSFMQLFTIIWNVLGAVVFWTYVYKEGVCDRSTNTYIFVSLVIKLVVTWCNLASMNKKE
jgi:hypothetical protein